MGATIHTGDAIKWAWQYEGPRFHALLCDPPYELGFMGKDWDRSGVAFDPATWQAFYAILLPGAFGMAFASSRGWHRLACAIEDAGFVIHPTIFGWTYGSGFPKATRIDTQIDKVRGEMGGLLKFTQWFRTCGASRKQVTDAMVFAGVITDKGTMAGHYFANSWDGQPAIPTCAIWKVIRPLCGNVPAWIDEMVERIEAEREIVGEYNAGLVTGIAGVGGGGDGSNITTPATPLAQSWAGHRYGLQALKPALEPIIVFQRPYEGRAIDCITETGAGAINIDLSRIRTNYHNLGGDALVSAIGGAPSHLGVDGIHDLSPESYRGLLLHIVFVLRSYSNVHTSQAHNEGGLDGSLPDRAEYELLLTHLFPSGVWCGANLLEVLNSLNGCPSCHRLYDGQLRHVQEAAQAGALSLADALEHICRELPLPSHNLCSNNDHLYRALFILLYESIIPRSTPPPQSGRWPSNFILLDDEAAAALDRQSGVLGKSLGGNSNAGSGLFTFGQDEKRKGIACGFGDSGGASRFFFRVSEQLDEADPVRYCAKASRSERDAGLEGEPMEHVRRHSGGEFAHNSGSLNSSKNGAHLHNPHPTVKPIALARYLATLLLPPSEYAPRRLFVPFAGVGSEMIGAHQAGWEIIEGVELEDDSADIGRKRLDYWVSKPIQTELFVKSE